MASIKHEDDTISYCGSLSGETFSSRRRRNTCSLRQHSIDVLANQLKEHPFDLEKHDDYKKASPRFNKCFHSFRFIVAMLGGFSLGTMMILRYNVTVAILNMVNQTALYMHEHPDKTMDDFLAEGYSTGGEFNWDNEIQHMIMSWYMVAYTLPQVPTTRLGMMIGSRWSMPISLGICAIATILTPPAAYLGWQWVIALRMVNGIGASAVLPMMLNILEQWMPYDEISLGLTCAQLLTAVLLAFNSLIAGYLSALHWSYAFYVPGLVTIAFCLLWMLLVTDRPEENWLISQKELNVICGCNEDHDHSTHNFKPPVTKDGTNTEQELPTGDEHKPTWLDIMKVPSFYASVFSMSCYCSSFSSFSFILPTYLRQFLKISVSQNGVFCFIIQSGLPLSVVWPHPFLRILQTQLNVSLTNARRVVHAVICSTVAGTWFFVGFFHQTQLIMLFINRCFHGSNDIVLTGTIMSNYAKAGVSGLAFSMVNTVSCLSVVFASTSIGYYLDYTGQSREGWTCIFSALALGQLVMLFIFVTFTRSEPIEFKKKNNEKNSSNHKQAIINKELDGVEIVCNKKDGITNDFDKLCDQNLARQAKPRT